MPDINWKVFILLFTVLTLVVSSVAAVTTLTGFQDMRTEFKQTRDQIPAEVKELFQTVVKPKYPAPEVRSTTTTDHIHQDCNKTSDSDTHFCAEKEGLRELGTEWAFSRLRKIGKTDTQYMQILANFLGTVYAYLIRENTSVKDLLDDIDKRPDDIERRDLQTQMDYVAMRFFDNGSDHIDVENLTSTEPTWRSFDGFNEWLKKGFGVEIQNVTTSFGGGTKHPFRFDLVVATPP